MADVISRLKLESGEFDSKIKRAAQGIQRMAEECHNAGGILNQLEDENRDYIQSLGSMATVATTAKGKLAELTAAFTDIRSQYNALSDEEKQGEFGQELNKQLEIMKGRINSAKTELGDINKELGNTGKQSQETGGFLDKLKDRFVINIDAMKLFDLGLKAIGSALDVAKDAFMSSETNADLWGQTMEAAGSIYEGFVISLNNGDFGGFLNNISRITKAANDAYNALDKLQTVSTIISPERARLQAEQTRLQSIIRKNGKDSAEGRKAQQQLRNLEPQLTASYRSESRMNRDVFRTQVIKRLEEGNIRLGKRDLAFLMRSFESEDAFNRLVGNARGRITISNSGPAGGTAGWQTSTRTDTRNINAKLRDLFTDEWRQTYSPYLTASYSAMNSAYGNERQNARYLNSGGGGGGGRGGGRGNTPYVPQTAVPLIGIDMPWWQKSITGGLQGSISALDVNTTALQQMQSASWAERGQKNPELTKIADTMDESSKAWADMGGSLNSIVAGVEGLGIEVPSGFKKMISLTQSVSSIMSGISSLLLLINTTQWSSKLIPSFGMHTGGVVRAATGTVVPGNYGFDAVPALLTSGETVLTRAQAGNIASQLQQGSKGESTMQPYTTGEYVYLGVKNHLQRNGQGEIVTTGMLRRMGLIG